MFHSANLAPVTIGVGIITEPLEEDEKLVWVSLLLANSMSI